MCAGSPQELITATEDSVVTEVTQVLREWSEKWKQLFVVSSTEAILYNRLYFLTGVIKRIPDAFNILRARTTGATMFPVL